MAQRVKYLVLSLQWLGAVAWIVVVAGGSICGLGTSCSGGYPPPKKRQELVIMSYVEMVFSVFIFLWRMIKFFK